MRHPLVACLALILLAGCGQKAEEKKAVPPPSLITVTQAAKGEFEVVLETLGTLEVLADPKIGAEVAGRVTQVLARTGTQVKAGDLMAVIDAGDVALQNKADEAEARRIEALAKQQEKLAERQQTLMDKGFLSKNAGEDVAAQRTALAAQHEAARARADNSRRSVGKTQVRAPIDGIVEVQIVSPGDYVKVGDPLFHLVAPHKLRAHLPFPESLRHPPAGPGRKSGMTSPLAPGKVFDQPHPRDPPRHRRGQPHARRAGRHRQPRGPARRRHGQCHGAHSAKAEALTVPEQSVVLRPAGKVVYVIAEVEGPEEGAAEGGQGRRQARRSRRDPRRTRRAAKPWRWTAPASSPTTPRWRSRKRPSRVARADRPRIRSPIRKFPKATRR
jgi:membrane fusion protein (multidrug efflux system)